MRLSVVLLVLAGCGVLVGGWLVGRWALGVAVVFDSLCVGVFALGRDDGSGGRVAPVVGLPAELERVLERSRLS